MTKDEILQMARECGIDKLNPMGFYITQERFDWLERFTRAAYAKGAEDMRERVDDAWSEALQSDCENGVKWLSERVAEQLHKEYPALARLGETIRALPIMPTEGEQ